jgi:dihydrofolate reductase
MLSLIVAMDRNRVIGLDNKLPWHLPADLKRFKELTTGHHVVMGRKTFESIGKPLPGRTNVVVTRQHDYKADGIKVVHSLDAAIWLTRGDPEPFIIGGGELYKEALKYVDKLYVTEVDTHVERGDAHFPELDPGQWKLVEKLTHDPDPKNKLKYTYLTYVKNA